MMGTIMQMVLNLIYVMLLIVQSPPSCLGGHVRVHHMQLSFSSHSRPCMCSSHCLDTHTHSYRLYYILSVSRRGCLCGMQFSCCLFSKYSM